MSINWGYILEAKGRPTAKLQRRALSAVGVDMSEHGTCWHDVMLTKTTKPSVALEERAILASIIRPGHVLNVVNPLCLALSDADIKWFTDEIIGKGARIYIIEKSWDVGADELPDLLEIFRKARPTMHQRNWRQSK